MTDEERRRAAERVARARAAAGSVVGGGKPPGTDADDRPESAWEGVTWPMSTARFVFLGEAVLQLGRGRFGPAWSGGTADERAAVAERIVRACADGALGSHLRRKSGGQPRPLDSGLWFSERWREIVESCAVEDTIDEDAWVFLDRASFEKISERVVGASPPRGLSDASTTITTWARNGGDAEASARATLLGRGEGASEAAIVRELGRLWRAEGNAGTDESIAALRRRERRSRQR